MSPRKEWLDFLTATTDARCQKVMQDCVYPLHAEERPLFFLCAVLSYINTGVFSQKVTAHKP